MARSVRWHATLLAASLMAVTCTTGLAQSVLDESEERVIHYESNEGLADPVTLLQRKIASGSASLTFETNRGHLRSLLQTLEVPISSQTLVFSRTSSQRAHTSPATPRAIYFSDTVSVGWAQGAEDIDIVSIDPKRGAIFYTLSQTNDATAKFTRRSDCMQCHLGPKTIHVPGLVVRSYFTDLKGTPVASVNEFVSGHDAPISSRWGGWYVTGESADRHLGNSFVPATQPANELDVAAIATLSNNTRLQNYFDASHYLSDQSDIVALLVLEHQTRMQNLITHAHYETLLALADQNNEANSNPAAARVFQERIARAGDMLLEYLLFRNEAKLKGPVRGSLSFANDFQSNGVRDAKGRSLRELDLNTRLFRYPCSYMVYSPSLDGLPAKMRDYLWTRLERVLTGNDRSPAFAAMSVDDRKAVLEILRETKPEFASRVKLKTEEFSSISGCP